ncbi:MAG: PH domain-containing protein [Candidatus Thorarchaeota archaeon]|nr:PH domain-containing protein [Candidatus Thorarchaeota archaeon]
MSSDTTMTPFPPEKKERLVIIFHPKRVSLIFFYVFSTALVIMGVIFMSASTYGAIPPTLISWVLGNAAIIFGILLFARTEMKRTFTLYIITTWNVRIRKGVFKRQTTRLFYDEISECRVTIYPDEQRVGMGDVEICSTTAGNEAVLIFEEVENPEGVCEIINKFIQTLPYPLPWGHLERD